MSNRSLWLRVAVSCLTLLSLFFVYEPATVAAQMRQLWPIGLVGATLLLAVCTMVMALKWKVLLPDAGFGLLLRAITISFFYSLLPTGQLGGEMSKLLVVKSARHPLPNLIASIVFDKITGLIGLLLIGLVAALASAKPFALILATGIGASLVALCGVLMLSRVAMRATGSASPRQSVPDLVFARSRALVALMSAYSSDPRALALSIILGIASQAMVVALYLLLAHALGLQIRIVDFAAIVVVANVAALVPISIAGLGVREASLTVLLSQLGGVPGDQALACSLSFTCVLLIGAAAGAALELQTLVTKK